jgi:thioesterase superfamily protein 4
MTLLRNLHYYISKPMRPIKISRRNISQQVKRPIVHLDHFKSVPWCADIINNPDWIAVHNSSFSPEDPLEHTLLAKSLSNDAGLRAHLTLIRKPDFTQTPPIQEVLSFYDLGTGLNGWPRMLHGGFAGVLIDQQTLFPLRFSQEYLNEQSELKKDEMTVTGYLNVRYLAPIRTPSIICITAKVAKIEGRKSYVKAIITDSQGKELTVGETLYIKVKVPRDKV